MEYRKALKAIDTVKALEFIGVNQEGQGGYLKFTCPECKGKAAIKLYGKKKNLWYCPECKKAGHIIALVMAAKGLEYEDAKKALLKLSPTTSKLTKELKLDYELEYHDYLKEHGIPEDVAKAFDVGVPKGKSMLAGCIAFAVYDEHGTKIAYYGINIKKFKPVFHKSFNPEMYLYGYHAVKNREKVFVTDSMIECVRLWSDKQPTVCNFGLPYFSETQLELLNKLDHIVVWTDNQNIKIQLMNDVFGWLQFVN